MERRGGESIGEITIRIFQEIPNQPLRDGECIYLILKIPQRNKQDVPLNLHQVYEN